MAQKFTICVGTVGAGVWFSPDGGDHWRRSKMDLPFHAEPGEIQIRSLSVSPHNPHHLLAGSEAGLYRSEDNGATWKLIESPMDGMQIWSTAWHPTNPKIILAGTKPPAVYRSQDSGASWEKLSIPIVEKCFAGAPKVTNILFDPRDEQTVFVGVEIDGVFRSRDGGDNWTHLPALGPKKLNGDIHGLAFSPGPEPKLLATTPDGIWSSVDEGQTWSLHGFPRFTDRDAISYCRGVALKPGRSRYDLRRQRRFHSGQARRDSAHHRRRTQLVAGEAAGRAEFGHLLAGDESGQSGRGRRQQPARLRLYQRGCGRIMEQSAARIRRNPRARMGPQLVFSRRW